MIFKKYIGDLFFPLRFYIAAGGIVLLFVISFFIELLYPIALLIFWVFLFLLLTDYVILFILSKAPHAKRVMGERFSNGDDNKVQLIVKNNMRFPVLITIVDELPFQFQQRNFNLHRKFQPLQEHQFEYSLRPAERGEYAFGKLILYLRTLLGLAERRVDISAPQEIAVYPSYLQLRKYRLITQTALVNEKGSRRMRKIGQSMEFEQIKDYITGDDIRSLNWKASARKGMLMVNNYVDEKSQQVYCIIDKGRLMKMPFGGLTLLDYAINSTLALGSICLQKQDRIGMLSFADKMGSVIAADRKPIQRERLLQALYKQETAFLESDFEMLYLQVRSKIKQRSLLVLYTNFESLNGLNRQINYLRSIARHHLLLVVFFENTDLTKLAHADALNVEDVYVRTIAEKFVFEKRLIVKELQKYGILSILTSPESLTINTINKYLELKTRQAL